MSVIPCLLALKKVWDRHKGIILICVAAFILRGMVFLRVAENTQRAFSPDSYVYEQLGINILAHGVFSTDLQPPYSPNTLATPGYPFLIAAVYGIFGRSPIMVIFLQLVFGTLVCLLVYRIGREIFNEKTGLIAALFLAFDLPSISYTNSLLTETLFTLLLTGSIYCLVGFFKHPNKFLLLSTGVLLGLAALCRPIAQYLFIPLGIIFILLGPGELKKRMVHYLILTVVFFVMLAPWLIRNYTLTGIFDLTSLQGVSLLFLKAGGVKLTLAGKDCRNASSKYINGTTTELIHEIETQYGSLDEKSPAEKDRIYKKKALGIILQHPLVYLRNVLSCSLYMLTKSDFSTSWFVMGLQRGKTRNVFRKLVELSNLIFVLVLWFGIIYGGYFLVKEQKYWPLVLLLTLIGYFTFLSAGPEAFSRFRVPIMPYIALLGSYGLVTYLSRKALKENKEI